MASSWRNSDQPGVVLFLRSLGHEVYDFRHPRDQGPNDGSALEHGFHWSDIDPEWEDWTPERYRAKLLGHPLAAAGFASDWAAMNWADTGMLVLASGRSAHLEAGYFVGHPAKQLHVLLPTQPMEPELMYLMADGFHLTLPDLESALAQPVGAALVA